MSESHFEHLLFPDSVVTHVRGAAAQLQHYYGHYRCAIRDALNRFSRKPFQCGGLKGYDQLVAIEQHLQQRLGCGPDPYLLLLHDQVQCAVTVTATQAEEVRQMHAFLTRVEHYLAEVPRPSVRTDKRETVGPTPGSQTVQQELERMFSDLAQQFKTSRLAWQMTRKWRYMSKAWLPNILHCYDIPGLPRSNLDLESVFGSLRRGQRRTSGRKETALVRIFGPGEIVLLSLEEEDILPLLQSVPADVYWSQRRRQEEREEPRRWLRRLHRDPVRALTQVDQQFYQVVNAHTRASADAL
ncbi:MAG: hypothetical protein R6X16_08470 [Anaerolineae bacterium]